MLPVAAIWLCAHLGASYSMQTIPVSGAAWKITTQSQWRVRVDHRNLLAMRYPWKPSVEGGYASAQRRITIPADWQGPISLAFYCSDDYQAPGKPANPSLSAEGFVGHRFKQILVDGAVVWSTDVADRVIPGKSPRYRLHLTVKPGQTFLLTLLVYDAVASSSVQSNDYYQSARKNVKRADDPSASNFETSVYWGDLTLFTGNEAPPPGKRPSEARVTTVHEQRWPLPPPGDGWKASNVNLQVSAPAGLPAEGFPLECGLPLPAGKTKTPDKVRFLTSKKRYMPVQKTVTSQWPDDSIRWLLLGFPVRPGQGPLEMGFTTDTARFYRPVKSYEKDHVLHADSGSLFFDVSQDHLLENLRAQPSGPGITMQLALQSDADQGLATTESWQVIEKGPFRWTVEIRGRFDTVEKTLAGFHVYCSVYAGLPYMRLWIVLMNNTDTPLAVSSFPLQLTFPQPLQDLRTPAGSATNGVTIVQRSEKKRTINGAPADPAAPMFLAWKGGVTVVRHFRELYPKKATAQGNVLTLDLAPADGSPIIFTPGETKSHEVWVALGNVNPAQFAATVNEPPILQNPDYFCATGVIGPAGTQRGVPVLDQVMTTGFGNKTWDDFRQSYGIRDFPDATYQGVPGDWCNNYYERMLGLWSEWFISGDRHWFDLAQDESEHLMDVAVIHSAIPGKDWKGAMHGPGADHVAGPWNPLLRADGLALYQKLTGTPGTRDAFLGVADFCVRTKAGRDGLSARQQAGPFDSICTAYDETGDLKYLEDGKARVDAVMRMLDRRRGVWPEAHGSDVYRGGVPWMEAQLARPLYRWYRLTGDIEAAQALVGLADAVVCESTDWDHPGEVAGYSNNPHFPPTAAYDPLITPMIFAAYDLTGDTFYLTAAKAEWQCWLREKPRITPLDCYWNTPWLVWDLKKYGIVKTTDKSKSTAPAASATAKKAKP